MTRPNPSVGSSALNTAGDRQQLAEVGTYSEAQKIVDRLSDAGFDVGGVQIVGSDLKSIEQVTGRLTTGRAALLGAAGGAWWGLFVGLLLGIFATDLLGPVLTGLIVGAVFGALSGAAGHAALRGQRDFASVQAVTASRYEVLVASDRAADAQRLLGTG